jgi:hypothetical protein
MKKCFFLFLVLTTISCSNSNDSTNSTTASINPPSWIQGTWDIEGSLVGAAFIFTNNDLSFKSNASNVISYKQLIQNSSTTGNTFTEEEITSTIYNISITIQGTTTTIYNFRKISPTKIEFVNDPLGDLVDTYCIKR